MRPTPARLLLVLSFIAMSCATLEQMAAGAFQKPTLAYKSTALTDVSLSGAAKDPDTLEPGKPQAVSLPLTIPFSGAFTAAQAILKVGTVPIALVGRLQSGPAPVPFALKTTAQFRR